MHWNLARDGDWSAPPGPGHIMKLRYTSLQVDTGAAEERHPDLPATVSGMPGRGVPGSTARCAVVAAAAATRAPASRLAYVMTDGAALPLALSDLVARMRTRGLLDGHRHRRARVRRATTRRSTCRRPWRWRAQVAGADARGGGHGAGGRRHRHSALGTSALEVAGIVDAAARRAPGRAVLPGVAGRPPVPSPGSEPPHPHRSSTWPRTDRRFRGRRPAAAGRLGGRAGLADACDGARRASVLAAAGLRVTSMGRGPDEDPAFYAVAGAAGRRARRRGSAEASPVGA